MPNRTEELLERIASGIEALAIDTDNIEIDNGPPICPSCGAFDPEVILKSDEGGRGPLSDVVIHATCVTCGQEMIALIESYSMHMSVDTAKVEMERIRAKLREIQGIETGPNANGAGIG